jgi:hypothetical protein
MAASTPDIEELERIADHEQSREQRAMRERGERGKLQRRPHYFK